MVSSIDDEWRKHRKVCTAAFTKSNLRLVRSSTLKQCQAMLEHWQEQKTVDRNSGQENLQITLGGNDDFMRLTLGVFGEAIFGSSMDVFSSKSGDQDNFCSRLMFTNANLHVALLVPKVMKQWPFLHFQKVDQAFSYMEKEMSDMLAKARASESEDHRDLLSLLSKRYLVIHLFCVFITNEKNMKQSTS